MKSEILEFCEMFEAELARRYWLCEDRAATPSAILLTVLNGLAEARKQFAGNLVARHQAGNLRDSVGTVFDAMEIVTEPTMGPQRVVIERETAINNIAVMLLKRGLLNVRIPDPESRLEPFLALSPVVLLISEEIDKTTIGEEEV